MQFDAFIFLGNGGAPKPRGARGSLPPTHPLDEPVTDSSAVVFNIKEDNGLVTVLQ